MRFAKPKNIEARFALHTVLRSQWGRGPWMATVHKIDEHGIHFRLLAWPKDAIDPLFYWSLTEGQAEGSNWYPAKR